MPLLRRFKQADSPLVFAYCNTLDSGVVPSFVAWFTSASVARSDSTTSKCLCSDAIYREVNPYVSSARSTSASAASNALAISKWSCSDEMDNEVHPRLFAGLTSTSAESNAFTTSKCPFCDDMDKTNKGGVRYCVRSSRLHW